MNTKETIVSETELSSEEKRKQHFPEDWPKDGPIDLKVHDLPHHSSTTEWWYINSHIKTPEGRAFSLFASFFRKMTNFNKETNQAEYAHSITWAILDLKNEKYNVSSLIDKAAPKIGLKQLREGKIIKDPLLRRAAIELLEKGNVPYPDKLMKNDSTISFDNLHLDMDGNTYTKLREGKYKLVIHDDEANVGAEVTITLRKPPIRHGDNGVVRGVSGEDMFYYFIPRCDIEGFINIEGEKSEIDPENSSAWYDHEFGRHPEEKDRDLGKKDDVSWNWISGQMNNGYEFTAYELINDITGNNVGKYAVIIDPKGKQQTFDEFTLTPYENWTSMRTFNDYPTQWTLEVPAVDLKIKADAAQKQQEFMTVISKPAFWEGRMHIEGTLAGKPIKGCGFVERSGFIGFEGMNDFFKAVGRKTRESVRGVLPFKPNEEELASLVSSKDDMHFLVGIDPAQFSRTMIQPIREIIDRGGKAWRSYLPLACCDVVGGNSQAAEPWLALPELLHVGSLIVDDVEDRSIVRRGGKTCHAIYGEATAINAGTACYFIGQDFIYRSDVPLEDKLDIYNLYFRALRAAHAGQAIDIDGFAHIMPDIVESGDGDKLEEHVMAIHLLKAAVPASFLGRMGVILGKGNEEQMDCVGKYLESIGLAFQIIDDVLNLRGFKDNLKAKGEDISHGKVTLPVAKAMNRLSKEERQKLWDIVKSQPKDQVVIDGAVQMLEDCGALDECVVQATDLVEGAWNALDVLVRDSFAKLMLRAFGWFVLEREY